MNKFFVILLFLFVGSNVLSAQNKIRWISWEEAMEKTKENPKKIFVDIYTEWCGWCKKLDASTLSKDFIAKYINENFYAVKFDAQYKHPIVYEGKEYNYVKTSNGNYHELAAALLRNNLKFPSVVFIDEDMMVIESLSMYINAVEMEKILNYYATDSYKVILWRKFSKSYVSQQNFNLPASTGGR